MIESLQKEKKVVAQLKECVEFNEIVFEKKVCLLKSEVEEKSIMLKWANDLEKALIDTTNNLNNKVQMLKEREKWKEKRNAKVEHEKNCKESDLMTKDVKTLQSELKRVHTIKTKTKIICRICKWHKQGHWSH